MALISYDLNSQTSARLASVALIGTAEPAPGNDTQDYPFDFIARYVPSVDLTLTVATGVANTYRVVFHRFGEIGNLVTFEFGRVTRMILSVGDVDIDSNDHPEAFRWSEGDGVIDFTFFDLLDELNKGSHQLKLRVFDGASDTFGRLVWHPELTPGVGLRLV